MGYTFSITSSWHSENRKNIALAYKRDTLINRERIKVNTCYFYLPTFILSTLSKLGKTVPSDTILPSGYIILGKTPFIFFPGSMYLITLLSSNDG